MKLIITENYDELSKRASKIIADEITRKTNAVLGLATGSTPIGTYKELVRLHKEQNLDFSKLVTFNLDEYYGLTPDNPQSYHYFMHENLFDHVNVDPKNIHIPDGTATDIESYCKQYDEEIEKYGGIDLQLLGIGPNGHIGFNEPDEKLMLNTHITDLTEETIKANSRFFDSIDEVPKKAITMGIGSIMRAKKILLLANGKGKAEIMAQLLNESVVSTKIPASLLMLHPDVTIIIDKEAAELVNNPTLF